MKQSPVLPCLVSIMLAPLALAGPESISSKEVRTEPVAAPFSWEGSFIGIHGGGVFGRTHTTDVSDTSEENDINNWSYDTSGLVGGIQWGYNWQRGCFVFGTESDLGYLNIDGSGRGNAFATDSSTKSNFYMTTRLRAGVAFGRFLIYGTGGSITVNYEAKAHIVGTSESGTSDNLRQGWTGGFGVEYAFSDRWSLKADYLYFDLENWSVAINPGPNSKVERFYFDNQSYGHIGRLGLNYHFGAPAPRVETSGYDKSGKTVVQNAFVEPEFTWTGPYAGLHFGGGTGRLKWDDQPPENDETVIHHDVDGIFGGAQLGMNYQAFPWLVLGTEAKFSGSDIGKRSSFPDVVAGLGTSEATDVETNIEWMASMAVRAGLVCPHFLDGRFMVYGKIGVSELHINYRADRPTTDFGELAHTEFDEGRFATLFGGGFEYAFNKHWSARIEYDFADYGRKIIHGDRTQTPVKGSPFVEHEQYQSKLYLHTIEAGINFHF